MQLWNGIAPQVAIIPFGDLHNDDNNNNKTRIARKAFQVSTYQSVRTTNAIYSHTITL